MFILETYESYHRRGYLLLTSLIYVTSYHIRMHVYLTIQTAETHSVYNIAFINYNIAYWDTTPVSAYSSRCIVAAKA